MEIQRGLIFSGTFIEAGAVARRNQETGKDEDVRYAYINPGMAESNTIPRIKMSDKAWNDYINSDAGFGDEVCCKVKVFASAGTIYYTAQNFMVVR